jgi:hypothetical protein
MTHSEYVKVIERVLGKAEVSAALKCRISLSSLTNMAAVKLFMDRAASDFLSADADEIRAQLEHMDDDGIFHFDPE